MGRVLGIGTDDETLTDDYMCTLETRKGQIIYLLVGESRTRLCVQFRR